MKRDLLAALVVVALSICGCTQAEKPTPTPPAAVSVQVVSLHRGDIFRTVSLPGTIVPNQQAALCAKVPGYLKAIAVDKGDVVREGDLLAELEAPELLADTAKFKADLEVAQIDFRRTADAQKKASDLVPAQAVDTARAKFLTAKANLERSETLLGFCKIVAPFDGVVTRRNADPGAFIPAAASGATGNAAAILVVMDCSIVRVQVAVPENEVPWMRKGVPATIEIAELPAFPISATLARSSSALDESRTMLVEFDVKNPEHRLLPGMFATAKIGLEKHENALLAPADTVLLEKTGASVFVVENNTARKLSVKTGFNDGSRVELLSGVPPEARVIAFGKVALSNGQRVLVE